jgi:hypothetical protein
MKTKLISTLFISVLFSFLAISQDDILKTNISGPLIGEFTLGYERIINNKNTLNIKVGYWKPIMSPFFSGTTFEPRQYSYQDDQGALEASVEFRFYMGKAESPRGFYIGPYFRNFNLSAQFTDEIEGDIFDVDAKVHTYGIGAQLGYQWIIKDVFIIDFSFFGAGIDYYNLKLVYTIPRQGFNYSSIVDDIVNNFEDITYLQNKMKNTVNPKNETTKIPFLFPGFRFSLGLGVAF